MRLCLTALLAVWAIALWPAAPAHAVGKGFWGPPSIGGVSQFPIYKDLGVTVFQMALYWDQIAPTRPANPRDPKDPAYRWPADVDYSLKEAKRYGMRLLLMPIFSPPWANGGRGNSYVPAAKDYADFVYAASRKYPTVHLWLLWGEPTRGANFQPLPERKAGSKINSAQAKAPRRYAQLLDAGYGQLKKSSRQNLVIGGNSFTAGDVRPPEWVARLRLPNGRPPRLDLYGHNPFCRRKPDLSNPASFEDFQDFSDLRRFGRIVDRHFGRHVRLFLSEFTLPTAGNDPEFNFWVTEKTRASWITAGFKVARALGVHTFGWIHLYDDPPAPDGGAFRHSGLIESGGRRKPGYFAFRRG